MYTLAEEADVSSNEEETDPDDGSLTEDTGTGIVEGTKEKPHPKNSFLTYAFLDKNRAIVSVIIFLTS